MTKTYGVLIKETEAGRRYRNISILDYVQDKGFYVLNEDRLDSPVGPEVVEGSQSTMLFKTYAEAEVEADKNFTAGLKGGFTLLSF